MQNSFIADSTLINALEAQTSSRYFSRGAILFSQGQSPTGLYIIRSGTISLIMKADNGLEIAHFSVGAGSILGLPSIVSGQPYTLSARAVEGLEARCVSPEEFDRLMHERPSLRPKVLEVLAAEVRLARLVFSQRWESWEADSRLASDTTMMRGISTSAGHQYAHDVETTMYPDFKAAYKANETLSGTVCSLCGESIPKQSTADSKDASAAITLDDAIFRFRYHVRTVHLGFVAN
jgi:CRP/FNR family cyclic AMP-dependent transcriptional regulator